MKKKNTKKWYIFALILILFIAVQQQIVYAASMGMSISKSSAYIGETFTVTISGINGKVNISGNANASLNISGSQWVDGSLTITGTAKSVGTGKITVTPVDVTTTAAEPEEVTSAASRSITIKEQPKETTPAPASTNKITTTPTTSTKSTTTTTKTNTVKTVETVTNKQEDNFYISTVTLKGIKENGEQVDIMLSPEFNKDTYEYVCNVASDIQKLELQKDAGEYTNSIIVTGLDDLKEGENMITLQLSAEDHQAKTYTIKVIKEEGQKAQEVVADVINENEESKINYIQL